MVRKRERRERRKASLGGSVWRTDLLSGPHRDPYPRAPSILFPPSTLLSPSCQHDLGKGSTISHLYHTENLKIDCGDA